MATIDFRTALNTISDVVQNRPPPLREFDQIYMKVGDLVIQAEYIARKFENREVVFIGDGDAISLSVMHLLQNRVFSYGPRAIVVLDFDERIVNSINHFAQNHDLADKIRGVLYNVCDSLPSEHCGKYDAFYTNPPWGASNEGQSVTSFVQRGIEALKTSGSGAIVIADDETLMWTGQVLQHTQRMLLDHGFIICEMIPALHQYHLDDAPDLASCCILARNLNGVDTDSKSEPLPRETLINFYGRRNPMKVHYVRDRSGFNQGRAADQSYDLEPIEVSL
jgi:N4-bis(aminopropyl)spermidine synthase